MENKPSITIKQDIPCGHLHCIFTEHKNGNFFKLWIKSDITKMDCGYIWIDFLQRLLTFSLRRAFEEDKLDDTKKVVEKGIIKHLERNKHIDGACPSYFAAKDMAYSCGDGIARCIRAYLHIKKNER